MGKKMNIKVESFLYFNVLNYISQFENHNSIWEKNNAKVNKLVNSSKDNIYFYSLLVPTKIFDVPTALHSSTVKMMQYLEPYTLVMEHLNLWP